MNWKLLSTLMAILALIFAASAIDQRTQKDAAVLMAATYRACNRLEIDVQSCDVHVRRMLDEQPE